MLTAARARGAALVLAAITAFSVGFEHVRPSIALAEDVQLTNLRLALFLTLGVWLISCAVSRKRPRIPPKLAPPLVLWLVVLLISAVLAPAHQMQAIGFVRDIALGIGFGWAVYDLARTSSSRTVLARALALAGMAVAAVGLAEAARIPPVVDWLTGFRYQPSYSLGEVPRVSSTLTHPNIAAVLLVLAMPLQLAWLVSSASSLRRVLLGLGLAAELTTLVLTISRTGAAVAELTLGLVLLAGMVHREQRLVMASAAAAVLLPVILAVAIARQPVLLIHLTSESITNWYRADYSTPGTVTAHAGEAAIVPIRLENTGERVWSAAGAYPFALSYHLSEADGTPVTYDGQRTSLPTDVPPGARLDLQAELVAPETPGTYVVEWDEVQEHVTWFSWTGSPTAVTYLKVGEPAQATSSAAPPVASIGSTAPPAATALPPPVRLDQWRTALRMVRERPLLGVGPDNFRWVYGDYAGLSTWDTGGHANSVYFELLADTGPIGFALFLWMAWRLLRASIESVWRDVPRPLNSDRRWIWRLAFAASLCAWFLHGVLDYFYEPLPTNLAFWLLAGLGLAAAEGVGPRDLDAAACASRSI